MDNYDASVSDAVWKFNGGDHNTGQALRDLIWKLRAEVSEPDLRAAIRRGIAAVPVALNAIDQEPFSNAPVFDDEILLLRYRFVREYEASRAFFRGVCDHLNSRPSVCGEHSARIGDAREAMRVQWLANAPTVIGSGGMLLADGRRVGFKLEKALINSMTVSDAAGTDVTYAFGSEVSYESDKGLVTLWFTEAGISTPNVGWTSDGRIVRR
jgi:hypothetical protein